LSGKITTTFISNYLDAAKFPNEPAITPGEILLEDYLIPMGFPKTPSREQLASTA
jgi:hypothetical protein